MPLLDCPNREKYKMNLSGLDNLFKSNMGTQDPGFSAIVSFDYYDGPESGLAIYPQGDGVRFSSLGDSKSRLFRAFELTSIDGFWLPKIQTLQATTGIEPSRRILFPTKDNELLRELRENTLGANSRGHYVSVGTPDFERILISPVSSWELKILRETKDSERCFKLTHKMIKTKRTGILLK